MHATLEGLRQLRRPEQIARARGLDPADVAPRAMLDAVAQADVAMAAKRTESGLEGSDAQA